MSILTRMRWFRMRISNAAVRSYLDETHAHWHERAIRPANSWANFRRLFGIDAMDAPPAGQDIQLTNEDYLNAWRRLCDSSS